MGGCDKASSSWCGSSYQGNSAYTATCCDTDDCNADVSFGGGDTKKNSDDVDGASGSRVGCNRRCRRGCHHLEDTDVKAMEPSARSTRRCESLLTRVYSLIVLHERQTAFLTRIYIRTVPTTKRGISDEDLHSIRFPERDSQQSLANRSILTSICSLTA